MISESQVLRTAIFDCLCSCLNLNNSSAAAIALIHEAYAEPENTPQPPRNRNVIYWYLKQDTEADPVSIEYKSDSSLSSGNHIPVIYTTLKYQLIIICYGPAAEEYANRIRAVLYLDGFGFPRQILRKAGAYPIPDPPQPIIFYEEEGSLWRRRADLTISLRVQDEQISQARSSITAAPEVIIRR